MSPCGSILVPSMALLALAGLGCGEPASPTASRGKICNRVSPNSFCSYCHNDKFRNQCKRACYVCDHKDQLIGGKWNEGAHVNGVQVKPSTEGDTCPRADSYTPCVTPEEANQRAKKCCVDSPEIPPGCYSHCRFNLTLADLYDQFYKKKDEEGACPWSAIKVYMRCFMGEDPDVRSCCTAKNVNTTPDTKICEEFCSAASFPDEKPHAFEYLECLAHWQDIFTCYWAYIN